jgi:hypothetical protein
VQPIAVVLTVAAVVMPGAAAAHLNGPRWARQYNAAMKLRHEPQRIAGINCGPVDGGRLYSCDVAVTPKPHADVACLVVGLYPDGRIHDQRQIACPWERTRQPAGAVEPGV